MAALAAIFLPSFLHAQITFERTYGGIGDDRAYSVQQTADGGYIIAGYTASYGAGGADVYLIRTDSIGDTLWTRTYGGADNDYGFSVQQTTDSGFIVAGYTNSHGAGGLDLYLIKTDSTGDTLWTRTYGGAGDDHAYSVQQTDDSGFVIAGYTESFGPGNGDMYLIRTDVHGETLWTRTYGGAYNNDVARSVQETRDGCYIVAGWTGLYAPLHGSLVFAIRIDTAGSTQWARTYQPDDTFRCDYAFSVQEAGDDGFVFAGSHLASLLLIRTGPDGGVWWRLTYGSGVGYAVRQTTDGGFAVGGTNSDAGGNVWLVKTYAAAGVEWTHTFGGASDDEGRSVQQTADGGYVIAGYTSSLGAGAYDVYLIKTNADGRLAVTEPKTGKTGTCDLSFICEPNPCRGWTTISLQPLTHSPVGLTVFDASGCLVHSELVLPGSRLPLDLRDLPSGVYFVRVDAGGQSAATRVVMQR
jgi:hypothetical protein